MLKAAILVLPALFASPLLGDHIPRNFRLLLKFLGGLLLPVGLILFVGMGVVSSGCLGQMRSVAWPVGTTDFAIKLPDGRYAVPLRHLDRVQIYSPDLHFLFGWQLDAGAGTFSLLPSPDGRLEVFTARGNRHHTFTPEGKLVTSETYPTGSTRSFNPPPTAVTLSLPAPWWSFPSRGPIFAWGTGATGILILILSRTRAEQIEEKRKLRQRKATPPGPIGSAVTSVASWFAAAVWATVGVIWFCVAIGMLIHYILDRSLFGVLVSILFVLIGCVLMFISITIITGAFSELGKFFARLFR